MNLKAGDVLGGRYELIQKIGSSGKAEAWLGSDKILERQVAIKFALSSNPEMRDAIERGAKITAKLSHPNILPQFDLGYDGDMVYSVAPILRGGSLRQVINDACNFSIIDLLRTLQQLASGIDYLASQSIVHRDLKPNNILLDEASQPYILDFGLALAGDEAIDFLGAGSVLYLAPEIFFEKPSSNLSDIYAFGILAFQCFTGEFPFRQTNTAALVHSIINDELASVRDYRPELPVGIDLVLHRLCAKNPEDRYQTASEAVDDLYRVFYSGQSNIEGKVFISYATKDKDYVHKLAAELRSAGVDIWIDQDIEQGSDWGDSIENALKACDLMLLITTEASMDSAYVNHEWSYFMGLGKPVYPFVPNTKLPDNIHPRLNRLQLVQGTGDMLADIQNIVTVLAGGNPKKLGGLDE